MRAFITLLILSMSFSVSAEKYEHLDYLKISRLGAEGGLIVDAKNVVVINYKADDLKSCEEITEKITEKLNSVGKVVVSLVCKSNNDGEIVSGEVKYLKY